MSATQPLKIKFGTGATLLSPRSGYVRSNEANVSSRASNILRFPIRADEFLPEPSLVNPENLDIRRNMTSTTLPRRDDFLEWLDVHNLRAGEAVLVPTPPRDLRERANGASSVSIAELGWTLEYAAKARAQLSAFIEDWDDPTMDVYNDL